MSIAFDDSRGSWLVTIYIGGKRIRKFFKTKKAPSSVCLYVAGHNLDCAVPAARSLLRP
jgi:hypothetical protein